jgi:hypothetical protein
LTPVITLNNSPDRWVPVATPEEPNESLSGFSLASAISSLTLFTPTDGCTTRILGVVETSAIGAKSRAKSNDRLGLTTALIGCAMVAIRSV